jgi:hypothetical protein
MRELIQSLSKTNTSLDCFPVNRTWPVNGRGHVLCVAPILHAIQRTGWTGVVVSFVFFRSLGVIGVSSGCSPRFTFSVRQH